MRRDTKGNICREVNLGDAISRLAEEQEKWMGQEHSFPGGTGKQPRKEADGKRR